MALNKQELLTLMKAGAVANPSAPVAYSYNGENFDAKTLSDTIRDELNEIAGTYELYRENKNTVFSLIEETITDVLPRKVVEEYGNFAEFRTVA